MPPETPKRSRPVRNLIDRIRGRKKETREPTVGEAMEIADIRGTVEERTEEARGGTAAMPEPGVDPLDRAAWRKVLAHEQDILPGHRLAFHGNYRDILQRAGDRDELRRLAFKSLHTLHNSGNLTQKKHWVLSENPLRQQSGRALRKGLKNQVNS